MIKSRLIKVIKISRARGVLCYHGTVALETASATIYAWTHKLKL